MPENRNYRSLRRLLMRVKTILKTEGFPGLQKRLLDRIRGKIVQSHTHVIGHNDLLYSPPPVPDLELEIEQLLPNDIQDIDQLTTVDEWGTSKETTLKTFKEGGVCYIAKHRGQIVACQWAMASEKYYDPFLCRELYLAPHEVYYWRGFTIPEFRGKGLMPHLTARLDDALARRYGKTYGLGLVRVSNKAMLKTLNKVGRTQVGRLGFIQIGCFRFHYLLGNLAFKETKKRFFFQKVINH